MVTGVASVIASYLGFLARGIVELAEQTAPDVIFKAAGGTEDGGIGTSYDKIEAAMSSALGVMGTETGSDVVVLADLESALITVEAVLDFADDLEHIVFTNAPVMETTVAVSVKTQLGDLLGSVVAAARSVCRLAAEEAKDFDLRPEPATRDGEPMMASALVADPVGLHARPAALVARVAGSFDAEVTLSGADATSAPELMVLGVTQGQRVKFSASDPKATQALDTLVEAIGRAERSRWLSRVILGQPLGSASCLT